MRNHLWGSNKHQHIISDSVELDGFTNPLVTISDEVFALFLYENCRDKWVATWRRNSGVKCVVPKPLYTAPNGKTTVYKGWNEAGERRFKELTTFVKRDRAEDVGHVAERRHLNRIRQSVGKTALHFNS